MNYKLTIPTPTKAPTPNEELLKLDLLELCKRPKETSWAFLDEVFIALRNRKMAHSHKAELHPGKSIKVTRLQHNLIILSLDPNA